MSQFYIFQILFLSSPAFKKKSKSSFFSHLKSKEKKMKKPSLFTINSKIQKEKSIYTKTTT